MNTQVACHLVKCSMFKFQGPHALARERTCLSISTMDRARHWEANKINKKSKNMRQNDIKSLSIQPGFPGCTPEPESCLSETRKASEGATYKDLQSFRAPGLECFVPWLSLCKRDPIATTSVQCTSNKSRRWWWDLRRIRCKKSGIYLQEGGPSCKLVHKP